MSEYREISKNQKEGWGVKGMGIHSQQNQLPVKIYTLLIVFIGGVMGKREGRDVGKLIEWTWVKGVSGRV